MDKNSSKDKKWGTREPDTEELVKKVLEQLKSKPKKLNFPGNIDTFLEMFYFTFTEYIPVETPELREKVNELSGILRRLVETDAEADEYMNIVFELCANYERQSYMQGMKVGARMVMELVE